MEEEEEEHCEQSTGEEADGCYSQAAYLSVRGLYLETVHFVVVFVTLWGIISTLSTLLNPHHSELV